MESVLANLWQQNLGFMNNGISKKKAPGQIKKMIAECLISGTQLKRRYYMSFMITSTRMTITKTAISTPRTSPPAGS